MVTIKIAVVIAMITLASAIVELPENFTIPMYCHHDRDHYKPGYNRIFCRTLFHYHEVFNDTALNKTLKDSHAIYSHYPVASLTMRTTKNAIIAPNILRRLPDLEKMEVGPESTFQAQEAERSEYSKPTLVMSPNEFRHTPNLTELSIRGINLSPDVPHSIGWARNLKELNIEFTNLTEISNMFSHLSKLTTLRLRFNTITHVESGAFDSLVDLTILEMQGNQIQSLPAGLFDRLVNLERLDLSNNRIDQLPDGIFENLKQLKWLYLSLNKLDAIQLNLFPGMNNQLQLLALNENNIKTISPIAFLNLKNLTHLDMHDNELTNLNVQFTGQSKLIRFNLINNKINNLPDGIFENLHDLKELMLANNSLKEIKASTFKGLKSLKFLSISNNQISSIEQHAFDDLIDLGVLIAENNRLQRLPGGLFARNKKLKRIYILSGNTITGLTAQNFTHFENFDVLAR